MRIETENAADGHTAKLLGKFAGSFFYWSPNDWNINRHFCDFLSRGVFTGNIKGIADPGKSTLKAILNASLTFSVTFPSPSPATTFQVTATATGSLNAKITNSAPATFGAASTRLTGKAPLDISQGQIDPAFQPVPSCQMTLAVRGFKQSSSAPTASGRP